MNNAKEVVMSFADLSRPCISRCHVAIWLVIMRNSSSRTRLMSRLGMAKAVADVKNRAENAAGFVSDDSEIIGFSHLHDSGKQFDLKGARNCINNICIGTGGVGYVIPATWTTLIQLFIEPVSWKFPPLPPSRLSGG